MWSLAYTRNCFQLETVRDEHVFARRIQHVPIYDIFVHHTA